MSRYGRISLSLMNFQMMRVISSPSISTTGFFTLIFGILLPLEAVELLFGVRTARHRLESGQHVLDIRHEDHVAEVDRIGETIGHDGLQERLEGLPIAALVDDHDRLGVQAQGAPGQDLEELLQGADAARQDHESVRAVEHLELALVHGLDDHGFGEIRVARLALQQEARDDAHDLAAALEGGVRGQTHQADATSAVNERYPLAGDQVAQAGGGLAKGGIGSEPGTAIDAEGRRKGHGRFFYLQGSGSFQPRVGMVSFGLASARYQ